MTIENCVYRLQASSGGTEELRHHLSTAIPQFMMPAVYVCLAALPRSINGKLDRMALPATRLASKRVGYAAPPIGDLESSLAQVWADLLSHERFGRHDSFFEIGGHSLLAVRMIGAVKRALDIVTAVWVGRISSQEGWKSFRCLADISQWWVAARMPTCCPGS